MTEQRPLTRGDKYFAVHKSKDFSLKLVLFVKCDKVRLRSKEEDKSS